ncbi:MAG: hypothetical protein Q7R56_02280 [Nanoarchaeota archaeon]|nr:hypothetical protein [Nanoarchaeota archaeon]
MKNVEGLFGIIVFIDLSNPQASLHERVKTLGEGYSTKDIFTNNDLAILSTGAEDVYLQSGEGRFYRYKKVDDIAGPTTDIICPPFFPADTPIRKIQYHAIAFP